MYSVSLFSYSLYSTLVYMNEHMYVCMYVYVYVCMIDHIDRSTPTQQQLIINNYT